MERHIKRSNNLKDSDLEAYQTARKDSTGSIREMRVIAKEVLGEAVEWDWDLPRTREGYYHYQGGIPVRTLFTNVASFPPKFNE